MDAGKIGILGVKSVGLEVKSKGFDKEFSSNWTEFIENFKTRLKKILGL